MENRLSNFCDQVIEAGWLASIVTIPLFFNIFSSRVFEPDKLTLLRSIVLIMAAAWLIRYLSLSRRQAFSPKRFLRSSPLALPALIFAGVYVLSTVLSVDPRISFWGSYVRLQGLVTNLAYVVLFFIVADRMRSRAQVDRLMSVVIITSVPVSIYGLVQHLQMDPLPWGGDVTFRVTSTMGNAIFLAAYLIMAVPITVVRLVGAIRNVTRPLQGLAKWEQPLLASGYGLVLVLQLLTILFTKSRGPWIALAVGFFLMGILWLWRLARRREALSASVAFAGVIAFVLLLNIPNAPLEPLKKASPYVERLGTILDMQSGTNRVRTLIWFGDGVGRGAAGLITESPWRTLLGHGPETMYVVYGPYYPPDLANLEARNAAPDRSHNDLLDYLVITGFLGLFAFLLVMVRGFSVGLQKLWQERDFARQGVIVGILGAVAAHFVESLTGIAIASSLTYTWALLGALAAIAVMPREERVETAPPVQAAVPAGSRSSRRRRPERREPPTAQRGHGADLPWYRRKGFHVLVSYLVLTGSGTLYVLSAAANKNPNAGGLLGGLRDPDPTAIVLGGYFWLLLGILAAALWVRKPRDAFGRIDSQALIMAVAVGIVAILLPVKLFVGGVIADMYFKKGLSAASAQRPDLAIAPYLTAVEWAPDEDYYFLFLGQAYLDMARANAADKPAQRIENIGDLSRFRDRSVAQLGRENLVRASLLALERAKDLNPLNTDHSANLGRLYRLWGEMSADATARQERFAKSIEHYQRAVALSPNAAHLRSEWGLVFFLKGESQQALGQYQEAIRLDGRYAPTYAYMGDLYRTSGDDDMSIELYKQAVAVHEQYGTLASPMDMAVHAGLGEQYFRKGMYREALEAAQTVAEIAPKDFYAHRNLALIYRALNDRGKALEEARLALSLAPNEEKSNMQAFITELEAKSP